MQNWEEPKSNHVESKIQRRDLAVTHADLHQPHRQSEQPATYNAVTHANLHQTHLQSEQPTTHSEQPATHNAVIHADLHQTRHQSEQPTTHFSHTHRTTTEPADHSKKKKNPLIHWRGGPTTGTKIESESWQQFRDRERETKC